jgi:hypothetical protein
MEIKKLFKILPFMLMPLSLVAFANSGENSSLVGEYEKISGPKECPTGDISLKADHSTQERILIFGSRLNWTLTSKDKDQTTESSEGGCKYDLTYEKSIKKFTAITKRSACPNVSENAVINENLELKEKQLIYRYEVVASSNKKTNYSCQYTKKK